MYGLAMEMSILYYSNSQAQSIRNSSGVSPCHACSVGDPNLPRSPKALTCSQQRPVDGKIQSLDPSMAPCQDKAGESAVWHVPRVRCCSRDLWARPSLNQRMHLMCIVAQVRNQLLPLPLHSRNPLLGLPNGESKSLVVPSCPLRQSRPINYVMYTHAHSTMPVESTPFKVSRGVK